MVSLEAVCRMTSDSLGSPHPEEWHATDLNNVDLLQQLGFQMQTGINGADRQIFLDSAYCNPATSSSNIIDAIDWQSRARDELLDQNTLNNLLDMPNLLNTSSIAMQFGMLPQCVWSPNELQTSASSSESPKAEQQQPNGANSSTLPNIESLMNVSGGLLPQGQSVMANEEIFNSATYFNETPSEAPFSFTATTPCQSQSQNQSQSQSKKAARRQSATLSKEAIQGAKKRKQKHESGNNKSECDEESLVECAPRVDSLSEPSASSRVSSTDDESTDDACDSDVLHVAQDGCSLQFTDEERALLEKEGVRLPLTAPLSKEHERILKRVRRKIRNKISAKNSRLKKQEYVDGLEKRVRSSNNETAALQRRVRQLEKENETLLSEVTQLRNLVMSQQRTAPTPAPALTRPQCAFVTSPNGGTLPPIDTLSAAPKGKLLLIVAFSFAIAFLPICGVQLRRPALLHSGTAGSPVSFATSPFGGASRILLAMHPDGEADDDASAEEHQHVIHVRSHHFDAVHAGTRLDRLKSERLANVYDEPDEPTADDNQVHSDIIFSDDEVEDEALDDGLSNPNMSDGIDDSETELSKIDPSLMFNLTTTFVEFLQYKRSEF